MSSPLAQKARSLGYAVLFAVLDLVPLSVHGRTWRERLASLGHSMRSSLSTLLNIGTVMILTLSVALVWGLNRGAVGWLQDYIDSNPLARAVDVKATIGSRSALDDASVARLAQVKDARGRTIALGAWGWNPAQLWFLRADGTDNPGGYTSGRTAAQDDPLLDALAYAHIRGRATRPRFEPGATPQAIVSRSLLRQLGHSGDAPPEFIDMKVEYPAPESGAARPPARGRIAVVAVAESIPKADFLITEDFWRAYLDRTWDPEPRFAHAFVGPVEDSAALLAAQAPWLAHRAVMTTATIALRAQERPWLRLERTDGASRTEEEWRAFAERLRQRTGSAAIAIEFPDAQPPAHTALVPQPKAYLNASVHVHRVEDVPSAVESLESQGYQVTGSVKDLAMIFIQVSKFGRRVLFATIFIVGSLSAISIGLSFAQAIQRKTPEIGILKACGASNGTVLFIYAVETLLVWAAGFTAGAIAVKALARVVDAALADILARGIAGAHAAAVTLVSVDAGLLLAVGLGALALCEGATFAAGIAAARLQPARALKAL
jgi:hypothetical protein